MEQKTSVFLKDCKPGMKVAETIFNNYGAIIIDEGTVLDQSMIDRLEIINIDKIKVYIEDESTSIQKKIVKQYNVQVDTVRDLIKDISDGGDLDFNKVDDVAHHLMEEINENRDIITCVNQIKSADQYTYNHCVNVSLLSMMIGNWLKYDNKKIKNLVYSGLLHDIGKAKVDPCILNKPGKLTDQEFEEMKKHVVYGQEIIKSIPDMNKDIIMGVLMHHERENGSGYVLGARERQIHEFAKIIAIADVYDAMTANRVYRAKMCPFEVLEHIKVETYNLLSPEIGLVFLEHICGYFVGDICKLNTGEIGEVIQVNIQRISKPLIRIDNSYVDLAKESELVIEELL